MTILQAGRGEGLASPGRRGRLLPRLAVFGQLALVVAWLWPVGFGGRMPVGGDVTQFTIGLMAVLGRALGSGRLPLWNDLWGYGFPGVGESQMGVFYPPHWLLYGLLPLEHAYTASLVAHTLWGSLGASWASRRFGASEVGSALAGFAWATCGFFLIHLPHQWGYTTGSWMPWAWGLAWVVLRGEGRGRDPFVLALVLTVQLLPGHFQLAFCTQVGVVVLALEQGVERLVERSSVSGVLRVLAALGWAFPMAALQLWPTYRLARLAAPRRDFEYLSGFAATPLHLVTFLTPGLFERSPLWRPLVWDPFHTSPEEYLGYVGVVPLFLALGAVGSGLRRSGAVRALAVVGLLTLVLGLGPYVPGFGIWCGLPGFSFFRAPARWILATSLALCLLAGIGFDGLMSWRRPGRALVRFALAGLAIPALAVLAVEVALASTGKPGWPALASLGARGFETLPWHEPSAFATVVQAARRPNPDLRVQEAWARQGVRLRDAPRPVFAERRGDIYWQELTGSALLFAALLGLAPLAGRRRWLRASLVVLGVIDLEALGRHRRVDVGPLRSLTEQSPVLARLAGAPRGTRSIDTARNLPMVAGAAPVSAYRTLDLPALEALTSLAGRLPVRPDEAAGITQAMRLTGAAVRVFDPLEVAAIEGSDLRDKGQTVRDPALAGWRYGADWVAQQGPRARAFRVATLRSGGVLAWLVPLTPARSAAILEPWSGRPSDVLDAMRGTEPLRVRSPNPERRELSLDAKGPSLVVVSQLADPEWDAAWTGPGGDRPATIAPAFGTPGQGAWQAVAVPGPGRWTLRMIYRGRDVQVGLGISALAATAMAGAYLRYGRGPRPGGG